MAAVKSLGSRAALLILLITVAAGAHMAQAQDCQTSLNNLNVCVPFVTPGSTPSPQCCGALQAVDQPCLCNTLRIVANMPSQCNLPAISCAGT